MIVVYVYVSMYVYSIRSDILRFCRLQHVVCDKSDRVSHAYAGSIAYDLIAGRAIVSDQEVLI